MKQHKNIIFTFDHELFLGKKSGHVQQCMIEPYKKLQIIFERFQVKNAIFFLDTTFLIRLKEEATNNPFFEKDWDNIKEHIHEILASGHYVYPHIHPHWMDAQVINESEWRLDNYSKYCFKNCSVNEQSKIWEESIRILEELGVSNYHKIVGFRAGGWGIQPFEEFKPHFKKHGIKYDFSVMPGTYSNSEAQQYDFTTVEWQDFYHFTNTITKVDTIGDFIEFPISVRAKSRNSLKERIWLKYLWKTGQRSFGNGIGAVPDELDYQPITTPAKVEMISIELMHQFNYKKILRELDTKDTLQFLSHPKMLTNHSLVCLGKFLKIAQKKYKLNFDFKHIIS